MEQWMYNLIDGLKINWYNHETITKFSKINIRIFFEKRFKIIIHSLNVQEVI